MTISLVLADDHPVVLAGLAQLLGLEPDFSILATCGGGDAAIEAVLRLAPDVLVVDLQMPGRNGLQVVRALHERRAATRVVILTAGLDEDEVLEAVRFGVRGIVLKDMAPERLVECIRAVHAGAGWLEQQTVSRALDRLVRREAERGPVHSPLTPRERELVRLVAQGLRNKEIARRLEITEGTVKIHLHNVYQKLGVDNCVALTLWAQEKGVI
ncbi:MAG TPA: response regulator transcription factor [Geminicoccaceae bacterium]